MRQLSVGFQQNLHDSVEAVKQIKEFLWTMAKVKMLIDQSLETPWSYLVYYNRLLGDVDEKSVDGKTIERVKKKSHLYILNNGNNWFSDYFWIYVALSFSSSWLKILAKMVLDHFVILQLLALRNMSFSHCRVTEGPWRMHHARQADRWMNAMFWKGTWQMVSNERGLDWWYPMKGDLTDGIQWKGTWLMVSKITQNHHI